MKRSAVLILSLFIAVFIYNSCEDDTTSKGTISLFITDAPIDMVEVIGVYLTINEIQYHVSGNKWQILESFENPEPINILELTDGASELLGNFELEAGHYTQLRFLIDAPTDMDGGNHTNPGCYVKFANGSEEPLFVPSGGQTGYKGVGAFSVPSNGEVTVIADFDARKSVLKTNQGKYILKPTIRLIVDNQAGKIVGSLTNIPEGVDVVIYAYEDETYAASEADTPATDTTARFPNAVTSDIVDDSDNYHLVFLAPMIYDLVVTSVIDGEFQEVLGVIQDVTVESKKTTNQNININDL